ncbi:capsular polysaccharide transport system permease protein [Parasphingopyxis lamellibrachiae]|uniref:Transport permease protein n=2 Tax=Parasphingopyxis lamellibrachiae TaxID=680125 RepID=A0A3D9FEM1_9SPHN|nr:capsular polysaccharide transport system permease protein [Parasphingopyxis lamellibrachiae]
MPFSKDWFAELRQCLVVMGRVIFAVIMRESRTRYGSSNIGYAWAIIDPLMLLAVFIGIFAVLGRSSPVGSPVSVFFVTGIVPLLFWRGAVGQGATAVSASLGLLTYPQVMPADIIVARILLEAATTVFVIFIFIVGLQLVADVSPSWFLGDPVQLLLAMLALFYFTFGTMFLSSSLARIIPVWINIWGYMSRPLFLLSGIFFTLEQMPESVRYYLLFNPVAHLVEWIRSAAIPTFESDVYSITYPMAFGTVSLIIGLVVDRILLMTGDEEIVS